MLSALPQEILYLILQYIHKDACERCKVCESDDRRYLLTALIYKDICTSSQILRYSATTSLPLKNVCSKHTKLLKVYDYALHDMNSLSFKNKYSPRGVPKEHLFLHDDAMELVNYIDFSKSSFKIGHLCCGGRGICLRKKTEFDV